MSIETQQPNPGGPSPVKRALAALEGMQARLDAAEQARREPIAIIGMGCRFPGGVHDAESFWRLLDSGTDAIGEVPPSRWNLDRYYEPDAAAPGKMYTRHGGFVDALEWFDAAFFHISPKEARSLDPQQRLLLETAWEALENAGIAPFSLAGKPAGVFVGLCSNDYAQLLAGRDDADIDAYLATGTTHSMAAGRLSYLLGWSGPNLAVDTACSSGLAAVHLAIQSLRSGECSLALAGAANCILTPGYSINFCKARMLAADGRCKTFAAAADGFVRGEGAGMAVLKRLGDARRDGDRVLAVIRGSAMNQDGHTSGPTVPSGPAQQAVIRRALDNAGVQPAEISYVEAHGTGTSLGDPIEAGALGAVFGHPLWVGSVKTNIGHLEGAAGIAGLLKVVLALQHRRIPANLHFAQPSPRIDWSGTRLRVPTASQAWDSEGLRRAGASSFGFSGTNVHVVVEEAAELAPVQSTPAERDVHVLTISARSDSALRTLASRLLPHIEANLPDTAYTLNTGRSSFEHRLAVMAGDGPQAAARLRQYLNTGAAEGVLTGVVPEGVDAPPVPPAPWTAAQLQALFIRGAEIDWGGWDRGFRRRRLPLPAYPFERLRHWYRDDEPRVEDCAYEVEWHPVQLPALRSPAALAAALAAEPESADNRALTALESLSAAYAAQALVRLDGQHHRVIPARRRLFERLLETRAASAEPVTPARLAALRARHPEAEAELDVLVRCGSQLDAILTGGCDPLAQLSSASGGGLEKIYRDSPSSRAANRLVRETMKVIAAEWPKGRPLRILEIGAGTGGTTAHLLDIVPAGRTEYVFTDISRSFLLKAQQRFADARFLRYQTLDIERTDLDGFTAGSFDVVIAGNVLHATADLRQALGNVYRLLVPGGLLLLLEVIEPQRWLDLTFGLLDGWWRFRDSELRRGHPLLGPDQWLTLIRDCRFPQTAAAAAGGSASLLRQCLLLARADMGDRLAWVNSQDQPEAACLDLLSLVQGEIRKPGRKPGKIWAVARGSNSASQAALASLGRVAGLEHPEVWGGFIHVPSDATAGEIDVVLDAAAASGEKEIAVREGRILAPRLVRKTAPEAAATCRFHADCTYLITGGFGFLGLRLAAWMAAQGARTIALLGRSGASSPEAERVVDSLRASGARIEEIRADASQPAGIHSAVEQIRTTMPPLRGIVHAAGTGGMRPVATLDGEQLRKEFGPKLNGARALHDATAGLALDFFILFSSASAVWGAKGQAHYAAANACLDALALERRRAGLPALSVNWGLVSGGGMISPEYRAWLTRAGVETLEPEAGFRAMFRLAMQPSARAVIARIDWNRFAEVYQARERSGLLDHIEVARDRAPIEPRCFRDLPEAERRSALVECVQHQFCLTLGLSPEQAPSPRQGFFDAGMDSLLAIDFKNRLEQAIGLALPSTVAFNYPNVESLAAHLERLMAPAASPEPEPVPVLAGIDAEIAHLFQGVQRFLEEETV